MGSPPPDEEVCRQDARSLYEECAVTVPLRTGGAAAIVAVLRHAGRAAFARQETLLRREELPDGFVVGVRARSGTNTLWTRARRIGPGEALVHHHLFYRSRRACVILHYTVRARSSAEWLEEVSETRASYLSGAPFPSRVGRLDPLRFLNRYYLRKRRIRDLVDILQSGAAS